MNGSPNKPPDLTGTSHDQTIKAVTKNEGSCFEEAGLEETGFEEAGLEKASLEEDGLATRPGRIIMKPFSSGGVF